ncbi:MAG: hypothetical protein V3W18_10690 [candidate division Zixibacteria bacterium]
MRVGILFLLLIPINAAGQIPVTKNSQDQKKEQSSVSAIQDITESFSPLEISDVPADHYSGKPDSGLYQDPSRLFDLDFNVKTEYIAALDIGRILKPSGRDQQGESSSGVFLGIRRPYYRIGREIRVVGTVDLKMTRPIRGIDNTLIIVLGYDLRKARFERSIDAGAAIVNIGYKISIPFPSR